MCQSLQYTLYKSKGRADKQCLVFSLCTIYLPATHIFALCKIISYAELFISVLHYSFVYMSTILNFTSINLKRI